MTPGLLVAALALAATPAPAPLAKAPAPSVASPLQRQAVIDLAYILGETHALHRACAGNEDNTWRGRMSRLLEVENPDKAYRQRLMESFNAGFTAQSAQHPTCTDQTAEAEREAAARGREIARRLAAGVSP